MEVKKSCYFAVCPAVILNFPKYSLNKITYIWKDINWQCCRNWIGISVAGTSEFHVFAVLFLMPL
jgi:hypothetical protein